MDLESSRDLGVDGFEELQELLVPVSWQALADDLAGQHIERREQGRGPVALVVVGSSAMTPGAVQCLNLGLLVHAQHRCLLGGFR